MSQMQFIPALKRFLSANGFIYTLRAYNYSDEACFVVGVGDCRRRRLQTFSVWPTTEALALYVVNSGFSSAEEWLAMLARLAKDATVIYLWQVEVIGA